MHTFNKFLLFQQITDLFFDMAFNIRWGLSDFLFEFKASIDQDQNIFNVRTHQKIFFASTMESFNF
ncbi:MAG: hypothetical protein A2902_02055 [Elusimicrobia bacterium RIFCSPLOWO2_01_FULL_64_13]|nr:MAG: hypothetical protein A2636_02430 [Elusimicrobia bacterium RIFCSPHIGHO2_01_FULL_64_10]OGR96600.1 MAG: hypothetical protein A2902_02055 [Elusimicrobia bacterium RIFCSPLOWO2_01_FULL_64_13]